VQGYRRIIQLSTRSTLTMYSCKYSRRRFLFTIWYDRSV